MKASKWKKGDRVHFNIEADGFGDGRIVKVKEIHDGETHYWLHIVRVASGTKYGSDNSGWPRSRPKEDHPYKKGELVHALDFELTRAGRMGR